MHGLQGQGSIATWQRGRGTRTSMREAMRFLQTASGGRAAVASPTSGARRSSASRSSHSLRHAGVPTRAGAPAATPLRTHLLCCRRSPLVRAQAAAMTQAGVSRAKSAVESPSGDTALGSGGGGGGVATGQRSGDCTHAGRDDPFAIYMHRTTMNQVPIYTSAWCQLSAVRRQGRRCGSGHAGVGRWAWSEGEGCIVGMNRMKRIGGGGSWVGGEW